MDNKKIWKIRADKEDYVLQDLHLTEVVNEIVDGADVQYRTLKNVQTKIEEIDASVKSSVCNVTWDSERNGIVVEKNNGEGGSIIDDIALKSDIQKATVPENTIVSVTWDEERNGIVVGQINGQGGSIIDGIALKSDIHGGGEVPSNTVVEVSWDDERNGIIVGTIDGKGGSIVDGLALQSDLDHKVDERDFDEHRQAIEWLEGEMSTASTNITNLQSSVSTLRDDVDHFPDMREYDELVQAVDSHGSDIQAVESDVNTLKTNVNTITTKNPVISVSWDEERRGIEISQLGGQGGSIIDGIALQSDLDHMVDNRSFDEHTQAIESLESDVQAVESLVNTAQTNITNLQSSVSTLQSSVSTLQSDLDHKVDNRDFDGHTQSIDWLEDQVEAHSTTLSTLSTGLNNVNSTLSNHASAISSKQAQLVSGTNIKTINGQPILGSGDITISGGGVVSGDATAGIFEFRCDATSYTLDLSNFQAYCEITVVPQSDYENEFSITVDKEVAQHETAEYEILFDYSGDDTLSYIKILWMYNLGKAIVLWRGKMKEIVPIGQESTRAIFYAPGEGSSEFMVSYWGF